MWDAIARIVTLHLFVIFLVDSEKRFEVCAHVGKIDQYFLFRVSTHAILLLNRLEQYHLMSTLVMSVVKSIAQ